MNNLLSYCGLVDAKISSSDKDLPVHFGTAGRDKEKFKISDLLFSLIEKNCIAFFGRTNKINQKRLNSFGA